MNLHQHRWPPKPTLREAAQLLVAADADTWTNGAWTRYVEHGMADLTGAPYAVAFNSCTSAIHAALHAMGCDRETRLAMPALTFAGTATGAAHIGADIRFHDVDPATLTSYGPTDPADIIVAVDLHGVPHGLSRQQLNDRPVLTDACQSLGTRVNGKHIGSRGTHAWSFSSAKMAPAPDGGAVTTDNEDLAERLRELRDYGISARAGEARANGRVIWQGGHNWRPSELSMALVASRLESIDTWVRRARDVTERLHTTLDTVGLWRQHAPAGVEPAWHKVRFGPADWDPARAAELERRLFDAGVPTHRWGVLPLHKHPAFATAATAPHVPIAEAAAAGTLCLGTETCPPMTWTDDEVERVCRTLTTIMGDN